jgi:hypothetical protein
MVAQPLELAHGHADVDPDDGFHGGSFLKRDNAKCTSG